MTHFTHYSNAATAAATKDPNTVQEKIEQIHMEQANADFYYLSEMIKDYIGLVGAVKEVFQVFPFKICTF